MSKEKILDITWGTIFKIGTGITFFYILYLIKDLLILMAFALIISVLFNPAIDLLQKKRIPRPLAAGLIYLSVFVVVGFSIYLISPAFTSEFQKFINLFPQYFEQASPFLKELGIELFENIETFILSFQESLKAISGTIFTAIAAIFGGLFATFTVFSLAFFISLQERGVERGILLLTPKQHEALVLSIWARTQQKIAGWFGARILCCLFVGAATYAILKLFNINYAVSLGLFAGLTNIIPILGPIFAGAVIAFLALLDSWYKALLVLLAFILIQQIESLMTPLLTRRFIGLPPALVLIAVLIGGKLWGILGAILTIPLAGILFEFLRDYFRKKKQNSEEEEAQIL